MRRAIALALLAAALVGCADLQPFEPPVAGEIPPGPGLLSGADGAFVITPADLGVDAASAETNEAPPSPPAQPPARRGLRLPPPDQDPTLPPPAAR